MNVKELFKNKGIGYWVCAGASVLSFIMAIIVFATWDFALPNRVTDGYLIGIVLLLPVLAQAAVTFFPVRFAGLVSIVLYGVAFGLVLLRIAEPVADYFNQVHYQGGDFGTSIFYAVSVLIFMVASVVGCFFEQVKDEKYVI